MWWKLRNLFTQTAKTESATALESATSDLTTAISHGDEIRDVVAELRYHRETNHFVDRIKASMRGI